MAIKDIKRVLYDIIKTEMDRLHSLYPSKINTKVVTAYPRTATEIDEKAIITIARVSSPEETKFITDLFSGSGPSIGNFLEKKGNLQTDIIEFGIWTLDPQYRDDLNLLLRQILFEKKEDILREGQLLKFQKVSGSDSQSIGGQDLPRTIYIATMNYLVMGTLNATTTDQLVSDITYTLTFAPSSLEKPRF